MSGLGYAAFFAACMIAVFAKAAYDRFDPPGPEEEQPSRDWLWPPRPVDMEEH